MLKLLAELKRFGGIKNVSFFDFRLYCVEYENSIDLFEIKRILKENDAKIIKITDTRVYFEVLS